MWYTGREGGVFMIFRGYVRRFSTENDGQYDAIGAFWDEMAAIHGRENLRGLGFGWTADTIEYAIGLKTGELNRSDPAYLEMELPDAEWQHWRGRTDSLAAMYEEIYRDGPLRFEIETFDDDGNCELMVFRPDGK